MIDGGRWWLPPWQRDASKRQDFFILVHDDEQMHEQ
jgi:hypothetical protein